MSKFLHDAGVNAAAAANARAMTINLDQSYKMDLDLWDCLGRIIANLLRTDLDICSRPREGKTPSCSQINSVYAPLTPCRYMYIITVPYSKCEQQRHKSDCTGVQSDLCVCCSFKKSLVHK